MGFKPKIVLIGGSAGSLKVLLTFLPDLKKDLSFPIVIVLHRKSSSDSVLVELLKTKTPLTVVEPEEKTALENAKIYLAPPDYHLLIEKDHSISLDFSEKLNFSRPSIDISFISASEIYHDKVMAILLSGANADGVAGLKYIKANNGMAVVQKPETAEVDYMPLKAVERVELDFILDPREMADFINKLNV